MYYEDTGGYVLVEVATIPMGLLHKGRPINWLQSILSPRLRFGLAMSALLFDGFVVAFLVLSLFCARGLVCFARCLCDVHTISGGLTFAAPFGIGYESIGKI